MECGERTSDDKELAVDARLNGDVKVICVEPDPSTESPAHSRSEEYVVPDQIPSCVTETKPTSSSEVEQQYGENELQEARLCIDRQVIIVQHL